jgi:four helix bundle protein
MNRTITSYRDLEAWQESMVLAVDCYRVTDSFPKSEQFGLTNQIRRASVSIASNIAEGHSRSRPAYLNHLQIAAGSQAEVETQVELALRLGYIPADVAARLSQQVAVVGKLIHGLMRSLTR